MCGYSMCGVVIACVALVWLWCGGVCCGCAGGICGVCVCGVVWWGYGVCVVWYGGVVGEYGVCVDMVRYGCGACGVWCSMV